MSKRSRGLWHSEVDGSISFGSTKILVGFGSFERSCNLIGLEQIEPTTTGSRQLRLD